MGRACSMYGEKRNIYRTLVGKPERKGPIGRSKRSWVNNIVDWINLAQDRDQLRAILNKVMKFGKFYSCCTTGGFTQGAQLCEVYYFSYSSLYGLVIKPVWIEYTLRRLSS
jgi:hypothetical protein